MPATTQPVSGPQVQIPTRADAPRESVSSSFVGAVVLHAAIIGGVIAWGLIGNLGRQSWGENSLQSGSISATMVPALPLPPKLAPSKDNVLASESESVAPKPPEPKSEPIPKKDEVVIPDKPTPKNAKVADKPAPEMPKHPLPTPPDTSKAKVGETTPTFIPMAVQQVKNGTASITVDDRSFGQRFAYYARIVDQKVSDSWNQEQIFPGAQTGMRAVVVFTINTDGTPSDAHILTRSGSAPFDTLAVRTIQRIDGFGPLPQAKPITVEFALDYKQP
jgi:protein TonB